MTYAEKRTEITDQKTEMAAPQTISSEALYKTPNYKGKKRSNINYATKHCTSDMKSHEKLMEKRYGVKLSVRKDVVNKTLFRALKRFYTDKFMEMFQLSKKESSESYMSKVKVFCTNTFGDNLESLHNYNLTYEQVERFMSIVISPNHVKSLLVESEDLTLHKEYYSCLYQYSHKKLAKMLLTPVCGYLFTDFINSGNLTKFITSCSTMSQNPDTYDSASENFLNIIQGKDKKALKAAGLTEAPLRMF